MAVISIEEICLNIVVGKKGRLYVFTDKGEELPFVSIESIVPSGRINEMRINLSSYVRFFKSEEEMKEAIANPTKPSQVFLNNKNQ
jgi:hypothetical protein